MMSKPRVKPIRVRRLKAKRWTAQISYRSGHPINVAQIEEIEELQDIVERGPDWNDLVKIVITYNRRSAPRKALN